MGNGLTNRLGQFFNDNETNCEGVAKYRLYLMRGFYVFAFIFLGRDAWTELIFHKEIWEPLDGVAYSFWAAYSTLMILGLRRPLKMLPLLLLQFFYKSIWLIGVALPLWRNNQFEDAKELTTIFIVGVVLDILIIPWKYVFKKYFSTT
ncbi:MAG: hypothetical protein ACKO1T_05405 [Sediminibacterium sp.]